MSTVLKVLSKFLSLLIIFYLKRKKKNSFCFAKKGTTKGITEKFTFPNEITFERFFYICSMLNKNCLLFGKKKKKAFLKALLVKKNRVFLHDYIVIPQSEVFLKNILLTSQFPQ